MNTRIKSMIGGAVLATALIGPTWAAAPAAPPAPSAPAAQPAPVAQPMVVADARSQNWVTWPAKKFSTSAVKFDDIVGTVIVEVGNGPGMTLNVQGLRQRLNALEVKTEGNTLRINGTTTNDVWNWREWFNFSGHEERNSTRNLIIKVTVPKGADVNVNDLVGDATIGDTYGHLRFEAAASRAKIGKVGKAEVSLAGSGKIDVAAVNGPLSLDIAGSGKVNIGPVNGPVKASIAGAGTAAIGNISGGLNLDIAGSGDITAASVNGRVSVDIAGSGSVKIATGTANPLHVDIIGSGNFEFGGLAIDPRISALGSGSVKLNAYKGKLTSDGSVTVKVNGQTVTVNNNDDDDDDRPHHHHHDDDGDE